PDSLAAILDLIRLGMAIAAMIRMIATTIKSSIREKPFCCFFMLSPREGCRAKRTFLGRAIPGPFKEARVPVLTNLASSKQRAYLRAPVRLWCPERNRVDAKRLE